MSILVGNIALNIALSCYLIHYLPQLWHNRNKLYLQKLNLHFHGILCISYLCDLIYGLGVGMPWQYLSVSILGIVFLSIQTGQLMSLHRNNPVFAAYNGLSLLVLMFFFILMVWPADKNFYIMVGFVEESTAVIFLIPAIYSNWRQKNAQALSIKYLCVNFSYYGFNAIAAHNLDWPLPTKLGTVCGATCLACLILQYRYYSRTLSETSPMSYQV